MQFTLIVTNTFLVASVCHCTGAQGPELYMHVYVCV